MQVNKKSKVIGLSLCASLLMISCNKIPLNDNQLDTNLYDKNNNSNQYKVMFNPTPTPDPNPTPTPDPNPTPTPVPTPTATPILISESQVNSYSPTDQINPSTAIDANGNYVVVWQSYGQDGNEHGIYAQKYYNTGSKQYPGTCILPSCNPSNGELRVNTYTNGNQSSPVVAMNRNTGEFVVAWQSYGQDGSDEGIYAQRYSFSGSRVGTEFKVNTTTSGNQTEPSIAIDGYGNFVIVWSGSGTGDTKGIYAQRYDSSGTKIGSEFRINTYTNGHQKNPAVSRDNGNNFIVTWESEGQETSGGSEYGIYAQLLSSSGAKQVPGGCVSSFCNTTTGEFRVNTYTTGNQTNPTVAMNNSGFTIAWQSYGQDGSGSGIYAQQFYSNAAKSGSEFAVNTYTTNEQVNPSISVNGNATNYLINWQSYGQDSSNYGVYSLILNNSGIRQIPSGCTLPNCNISTGEFLINSYVNDNQSNPSVAISDNSGFVSAWQSYGQDGSGNGIFSQRYNFNGTKK